MKINRKGRYKSDRVIVTRSTYGNIIIFILLFSFASFMLLPFIYAIAQSVKPIEEIFVFPPRFFAVRPTTENYYILSVLTNNLWIPFSRYTINSAFVTIVGTSFNLILASMAAFPLAKYNFPGAKWLFKLIIASLLFAGPVTGAPLYIIMVKMNLIDSPWAVILPALALPTGIFLMKNFMHQISDSIIEAATIDGAGIFKIFYQIAMPIVKPATFTVLIYAFQSLWNSTGSGLIYSEELKLLPSVLTQISMSGTARVGPGAASAVLMMIPPFVIFVLLQSRVLETMAHAGIKG